MKKIASSLIFLFLFSGFWVAAGETGDNPIPVSPGNDAGSATVSQSCPTFSWSAVDQASAYRIVVFPSPDAVVRTYEELAGIVSPLIVREIPGQASSFTLSSEERLQAGVFYAWYVQAVDAAGIGFGTPSSGRIFQVEPDITGAGMDARMAEILKSRGVGEDIITDAITDWKSSTAFVSSQGPTVSKPSKGTTGVAGSIADSSYMKDAGTEGTSNTFYGQSAGAAITAGIEDTFIGAGAGMTNTTGSKNTFLGYSAGYYNNTGNLNTFLGYAAGYYNTTGNLNTFNGCGAGYYNTTGYDNTFIGHSAGSSNTTGYDNTFIGYLAGNYTSTGSWNTFNGSYAGSSNTTGYDNTFIGYVAGNNNTTGSWNTFNGSYAGYFNTTGYDNTFIGDHAGYVNTTGRWNTFNGSYAGYSNTTGYDNTFIGDYAGCTNVTGSGNTFIGNLAGFNETGSNRLYIDNSNTTSPLIYGEFDNDIVTIHGKLGIGTKTPGYPVEVSRTGANASIVLNRTDGAKNYVNATENFGNFGTVNNFPLRLTVNSTARMTLRTDSSLIMASGATCTAGGVWTNASSLALKENIAALNSDEAALTLQSLNPVKYNYKAEKDENHIGFIAEEVPELVAMKDRKSLSPMDIVAVLTKVTQDQQKLNQDLLMQLQYQQQQILDQQQINEKMKMEIAELKGRVWGRP